MSTALKCPNPSCPYLFDPSRVPAGAVLTCPRCGMRFTLGPPAPATAAAQPPPAQFPPPPPHAADFDGLEKHAPTADGEAPRRSLSAAGEAAGYQTWIILFMAVVLVAGAGVAVYFKVTSKPEAPKTDGGSSLSASNLTYEPPGEPWTVDEGDVRAKIGPPIVLAFKRAEPDAYLVVGARDYEKYDPEPSDLRGIAHEVIDRNFSDNTKFPVEGLSFLGIPTAVAFKFEGTNKDGQKVHGLCQAVAHHGFGYWCIAWAGERDVEGLEPAFDALREKLKLDKSKQRSLRQFNLRVFGGHSAMYQLVDGRELWKEPEAKERPANGEDPNGDLLLTARVKPAGQDVAAEATLVAILLDSGGGDPLAQGRKYVEDRITAQVKQADEKLMPRFLERTGTPEGDPPSGSVETPTPVVRMQLTVQGASNFSKLLVVSAAKIGDRVVVIHGSCAWSDRELFEAKLAQIAGSLREPK